MATGSDLESVSGTLHCLHERLTVHGTFNFLGECLMRRDILRFRKCELLSFVGDDFVKADLKTWDFFVTPSL